MRNIMKFSEFVLNEGVFDELGLSKMKVFSKALADKFTQSILPDVKKLLDGDLNDRSTWIEEYKNIFRKACMEFGGAKKGEINKTCNKAQTLQKLLEHYIDPDKGLIGSKQMSEWVEETTGGNSPTDVKYDYSVEDISKYMMEIIEALKGTGISDEDIKKSGTYALTILLPYMARFYPKEEIEKSDMIQSGKLMEPEKAKESLGGGGSVSLD